MSSNSYASTDKPTTFAHPGWRVAYTVVSVGILGITLSPGNSLFVGFMMLAWGLVVDYSKFTPVSKFRIRAKQIGCWWSGILFVVNLLATFGALTIEKASEGFLLKIASFPFFSGWGFQAKWYWLVVASISIIFTIVDWIAESRELEQYLTSPEDVSISESAAASQME